MQRFKSIFGFSLIALLAAMATLAHTQTTQTAAASASPNWFDNSVWNNPDRDFKWYPPDPSPSQAKPPAKAEPAKPTKPKAFKDFKTTKEVAAELERLKDKAIMSKTEPDVLAFLKFQNEVMDSSSEYADVFRRVVWANPDIDYQQRRPTNNAATLTFDSQRRNVERATIAELAKEHGLFFFFRSDCPYCHQMAPMLRAFGQQTGMNILPISMDGGGLPDFAQFKPDNGLSQELGVKMVPALYQWGDV